MNKASPTDRIAKSVLAELDHFQTNFRPEGGPLTSHTQWQLKQEPFLGYALARDAGGNELAILVCRHYTPSSLTPAGKNAEYASYFAPLGRIITKEPGFEHAFEVRHPRHLELVLESYRYTLLSKDEFRPHLSEGRWDGIENRFAWVTGKAIARSLRRLLEGASEGEQSRNVQIKVQLPDQAILDAVQDDIFRLPINHRIRISGAPGTGKTTVLLKRLSQKTKFEFLTESEQRLFSKSQWAEGQHWVLFTPSDLLKAYLKEALAKELLPAGDDHVKVFSTFKLQILRDIGFLRVGDKGYFRNGDEQQLLKRNTGLEHVSLTQAFGDYLVNSFATAFGVSVQKFNNETRSPLGRLADENQRVLLKGLELVSQAGDDIIEIRRAQERLGNFRKLNSDINALVQNVRDIGHLQEQAKTITAPAIFNQWQRLQTIVPRLTTESVDTALFPEIPKLVDAMRKEAQGLMDEMSLRRLFELIPRAYQEFRELPDSKERYFVDDAEKAIRERVASSPEQDLLLFHSLEFVRSIYNRLPSDLNGIPQQVRLISGSMRAIIAVDEATDFSPLELACMERFALPSTGGVTISGDLMQRVTRQGLKEWNDLDSLSPAYAATELNVSYRQTATLFRIAKDLYKHVRNEEPAFRSAYEVRDGDPPPLSVKTSKDSLVEDWLTGRITEIFALCDHHLPSTAILVPQQSDVVKLYDLLRPRLKDNAIEVDASEKGQSLGDTARVRIFPVECIKGLEFEAVFYVGLDRMADIHKELIDKYFYVGLSRARSFLGVSYERQFPQRLQCVANHFVSQLTFKGEK